MDFLGFLLEIHQVGTGLEAEPDLVSAREGGHGEHIGAGKEVVKLLRAVVTGHLFLDGIVVAAIEDVAGVGEEARAVVGACPHVAALVDGEAVDGAGEVAVAFRRG